MHQLTTFTQIVSAAGVSYDTVIWNRLFSVKILSEIRHVNSLSAILPYLYHLYWINSCVFNVLEFVLGALCHLLWYAEPRVHVLLIIMNLSGLPRHLVPVRKLTLEEHVLCNGHWCAGTL